MLDIMEELEDEQIVVCGANLRDENVESFLSEVDSRGFSEEVHFLVRSLFQSLEDYIQMPKFTFIRQNSRDTVEHRSKQPPAAPYQ